MRLRSTVLLSAAAVASLAAAASPAIKEPPMVLFEPSKTFELTPGATAKGPAGLSVNLKGYGHEFSDRGDDPYVEIVLEQGAARHRALVFTWSLPKAVLWNGWVVVVLSCADKGPPHSGGPTTLSIHKDRQEFALGKAIQLFPGETAVGQDGLTITLLSPAILHDGSTAPKLQVRALLKQLDRSETIEADASSLPQSKEWNGWGLRFESTAAGGTEHSDGAPAVVKVTRKP